MSFASRKGYSAERAVELLLQDHTATAYRPRAGRIDDIGDIAGIPLVVSVKNHVTYNLAGWVDEMETMTRNANKPTGIVWAHRARKGNPLDWYVITSGRLFMPLYQSFLESR